MYIKSLFNVFSFFLIVLSYNFDVAWCHGRMLDPPQRGSMWRFGFDVPPNYNDMSNYCGGISVQWEKNKGKCGVCGDAYDQEPRDHEPGGMYATGIIGKRYTKGEQISITIDITANHMGYFEFRLCQNDEPMKKVEQECFDRNLLLVLDNNEHTIPTDKARALDSDTNKYKYFVPHKNNTKFYVRVQLPEDIECKSCILQWRYHAGNNYGKAEKDEIACLGCSKRQEEFVNCADIQILEDKNIKYNINNSNNSNSTIVVVSSKSIRVHTSSSYLLFILSSFFYAIF